MPSIYRGRSSWFRDAEKAKTAYLDACSDTTVFHKILILSKNIGGLKTK
jgi:hypothetical protein